MKKTLTSISVALLLSAAAVSNDAAPRGTVVGPEYCGDPNATNVERRGAADTLYTRVSNGSGGTFRRTVEVGAAECSDTPPRGTVVGPEYCGTGFGPRNLYTTLYTRVADGSGGTWRRTVEENSAKCPPVLTTQVTEVGDRFVPVVFEVTAPEGYDYEATLGNVTVTDTGLEITGDGRFGTGYITIAGSEYSYEIVEEPRCGSMGSFGVRPDCLGYDYRGPSEGFIYYGEDDDKVVQWEMGYIIYDSRAEQDGFVELFEPGSRDWGFVQKQVDRYNEIYRRSGVHVEYVLKEGAVGRGRYSSIDGAARLFSGLNTVDVYIAKGLTCPNTCGCAYATTGFGYNSGQARGGISVCGTDVDLHEIGHSLGLAHGPDNGANAARGYIWPEFGHGHSGGTLCGADLMSYAPSDIHSNSNRTCEEVFSAPWYSGRFEGDLRPSGDRTIADTAYHLNRIRYDVSLIHCDDYECAMAPQTFSLPLDDPDEILIEDHIDHIPNGRALLDKEARFMYETFIEF